MQEPNQRHRLSSNTIKNGTRVRAAPVLKSRRGSATGASTSMSRRRRRPYNNSLRSIGGNGMTLRAIISAFFFVGVLFWKSRKQTIEENPPSFDRQEEVNGLRRNATKTNDISSPAINNRDKQSISRESSANAPLGIPLTSNYDSWLGVISRLASYDPPETRSKLETLDPFGVRSFDQRLRSRESELQRILTKEEITSLFPCPADGARISYPHRPDETKAEAFRNKMPGYFLFFQHLRKAGGTNFCSLATDNLDPETNPPYFCMPDMIWSGQEDAGYLKLYTNEEISQRMLTENWRVAGNEWQNLRYDPMNEDGGSHLDLPAVFATSFRSPMHRAISQFRFECIEDRGCTTKNVTEWWNRRSDLRNIFATTFADRELFGAQKAFLGKSNENRAERSKIALNAVNAISQFHLVLVMEWLAYASDSIRDVLGFQDTSATQRRVRPFATGNRARKDGGENNNLGAKGTEKTSWDPKTYLPKKTYYRMADDLAIDEILTDVARRFFLERIVCKVEL